MAGQFAHICLVNSICTPEALNKIPDLMPSVRSALENYKPFCRLGAVSPDCPSLVGSTGADGWNGIMHYLRPADFVRYAIPSLLKMSFGNVDTKSCIAWLFGYTAHIVADYTIHPVVELQVGPYSIKKNRAAHRRCELDQDVFIFNQITGHEVVESNFLEFSQLEMCGINGSKLKLNRSVATLWKSTLSQYPRSETRPFVRLPETSLALDNWFATYINIMANFATKLGGLASYFGMSYNRLNQTDSAFLNDLAIPNSSDKISYSELFNLARQNILSAWIQLSEALVKEDPQLFKLPNANLDTGKDGNGKYVYWS